MTTQKLSKTIEICMDRPEKRRISGFCDNPVRISASSFGGAPSWFEGKWKGEKKTLAGSSYEGCVISI
jgi:hypothetical protein